MMSQNWMGSDFSNKDISKNTDIIDQYDHTLVEHAIRMVYSLRDRIDSA